MNQFTGITFKKLDCHVSINFDWIHEEIRKRCPKLSQITLHEIRRAFDEIEKEQKENHEPHD